MVCVLILRLKISPTDPINSFMKTTRINKAFEVPKWEPIDSEEGSSF